MAIFTVNDSSRGWDVEDLHSYRIFNATPTTANSSQIVLTGTNSSGQPLKVTVTGYFYSSGLSVNGTVNTIRFEINGSTAISAAGLDVSFSNYGTISSTAFVRDATKGNDRFSVTSTQSSNWDLGAGNDTITAGTGNDTIDGGSGYDTFVARGPKADYTFTEYGSSVKVSRSGETDYLRNIELIQFSDGILDLRSGSYGGDALTLANTNIGGRIFGLAGNDTLTGGNGNDTLDGGSGSDRLSGDLGSDILIGGSGDDQLFGGADNDTLLGGDYDDTLKGGIEADRLVGGSGDDRLLGEHGHDVLLGDSGRDHLNGGSGWDKLKGGSGDDTLIGEDGRDRLVGGRGADDLSGGNHDDALLGGGGDDDLRGGNGRDTLSGQSGDDSLNGGNGNDRLAGDGGKDVLIGHKGDDLLTGGKHADVFVFHRGHGNDTITDFEIGRDHIEIGRGASRFGQLDFTQQGEDVLVAFADVTILVEDTTLAQLQDADNFLF